MTFIDGPRSLEAITLIPARNFTPANRTKIGLIVLHSAESSERTGAARNTAVWMAGPDAPQASAHYFLDSAEVYRGVRDEDVAWAAPGANANGIHIEHTGRAAQTADEWDDPYSKAMLLQSARLSAALCLKWQIPPVIVGVQGLKRGDRGLTTHASVSLAFRKSDHTDPGLFFPLDWYQKRVEAVMCEMDR